MSVLADTFVLSRVRAYAYARRFKERFAMSDILKTDDGFEEENEAPVIDTADEEIISIEEDVPSAPPVQEQEPEKKKKKQSFLADIFDCFETFAVALVLMMVIFTFILRFVTVDGDSMNSTLTDRDKLVISDLFYTPESGDIVVLNAEGKGGISEKYIIKRIIATGGQTVSIDYDTWKTTVDGKVLKESYIDKQHRPMNGVISPDLLNNARNPEGDDDIAFTVPDGMLFVMGDNRNNSADSRIAGFFEEERLLGRVLFRISPFENFGGVE